METDLIKRTKRPDMPFTIIWNDMLKNKTMSFEAKGLLCYILHLPSDWIVRKSVIMTEFNIGRRTIDRLFNELEKEGYLISTDHIHGQDGKFTGKLYLFYDNKQNDIPLNDTTADVQKRTTVDKFTDVHLPTTVNVHLLSNNNITKKEDNESIYITERGSVFQNAEDLSVSNTEEEKSQSTPKLKKKGEIPPTPLLPSTGLSLYASAVDYWLTTVHPGWIFNGVSGKKLKSILDKIGKIANHKDEQSIYDAFVFVCKNLPQWYRDKDLSVLDQKFNEIIQEIKEQKNEAKNKRSATTIYDQSKYRDAAYSNNPVQNQHGLSIPEIGQAN